MKDIHKILTNLFDLSKLATKGEWVACGQEKENLCSCGHIWSVTEDIPVLEVYVNGKNEEEISYPKNWQENTRFIASSNPANILKIVDYVEQLQTRIKELESEEHINEIKAQGIEEFIQLETERLAQSEDNQTFRAYGMLRRRLSGYLATLRNSNE